MSEALKQRVIDFCEEMWHKGGLDTLDQYIVPDYMRHTNPGGREGGRE
jgi:predicted SnoaL-like aldol condensation-catalyzing enzyme